MSLLELYRQSWKVAMWKIRELEEEENKKLKSQRM